MKIKISDILLKENQSLYKLLESQLINELKNLNDYKPTEVQDQTEIIKDLLSYLDNANLTVDMFGELIEKQNITVDEEFLVFDIFKALYPKEYETLIRSSAAEEVDKMDKEMQINFEKKCSDYFEMLDSYQHLGGTQKKYLLSIFGLKLIQALDDGFKKIKENLKSYLFDKLLDKFVPETNIETAPLKKEYLKSMFDDESSELKKVVDGSNLSGWVIYVFGRNIDDSSNVIDELEPITNKHNILFFVTTDKYYSNSSYFPRNASAIMYLPYDIVKNGTQKSVLDEIVSSLSTYEPVGVVPNTKRYSENVYYSYVFNTSFDNLPEGGVDYEQIDNLIKTEGTIIFQPDLLERTGNYYDFIVKNITTLENFKDFIYSEVRQNTKKINWSRMGYNSTDQKENADDLVQKIFNANRKNNYLKIPKTGFEAYGINNLREFVKDLD
jgi:hypothetical protein